jgi:hypothetical protein
MAVAPAAATQSSPRNNIWPKLLCFFVIVFRLSVYGRKKLQARWSFTSPLGHIEFKGW